MPRVSELLKKNPELSDYILIGNGSLTISNLIKLFSIQSNFQTVVLESTEKIIKKKLSVYVLLDGTDYTSTTLSKTYNYFNNVAPSSTNVSYILDAKSSSKTINFYCKIRID